MNIENFRLVVFRTVAHRGSFSRAAEELLLTQPAVTQQIKTLEEEFGVPLFLRAGGRIALSPAGEALLPFAERSKLLAEEAFAAVAATAGRLGGALAVGASQTIAQYLLPGLVAEFLRQHPQVAVTVRSGNSDRMLQALRDGEIQLALLEGPEGRSDVHVEPFLQDRMVLAVPANHAFAGKTITPAEFLAEPLLQREVGSGSRRIVEQALQHAGLRPKDLRVRMEFDSTEGLLHAVEAGLGIAFVSRLAVRNQLALRTLRLARVEGVRLTRQFSLAYAAGPEPGGPPGAFCGFLRQRGAAMAERRHRPRKS